MILNVYSNNAGLLHSGQLTLPDLPAEISEQLHHFALDAE